MFPKGKIQVLEISNFLQMVMAVGRKDLLYTADFKKPLINTIKD